MSDNEVKTSAVKSEDDEEDSNQSESGASGGWLPSFFQKALNLDDNEGPEQLLETVDFQGIADFIKKNKCSNIITMTGAGISTSAGIPDFRSPGSGLYDNLQKYNLADPQAIFSIEFFEENPEPFFQLAKSLLPGELKPTPSHFFIKLLADKGLLLRHYTQNIDTLERLSGLPDEKIVEAHGTFHTSHCRKCQKEYSLDWMKVEILSDKVPQCEVSGCKGVVKPDIVFFGEQLPERFFTCVEEDMARCDLLIIMGTSLVVQPFASLMDRVPETTPRLYINREMAATSDPFMAILMGVGGTFKWGKKNNYRDVFWKGDCDAGSKALAELLGWKNELEELTSTIPCEGNPKTDQTNVKSKKE